MNTTIIFPEYENEQTVLGLDMGSNSIGWFLQTVSANGMPKKIIAAGSRIFDNSRDPKTRVPLSVQKRLANASSTRRDRQIMRTKHLCKLLKEFKLLPSAEGKADVSNRNPYKLRAKAAEEKIDLYGIGRAILHINKRRGFLSNRKADKRANDEEAHGMKLGISNLRMHLADKTLGQYLYERQKSGKGTRMRAKAIKNKNHYEMYADRDMYVDEFQKIWRTQQKYHKNLDDEMGKKIEDALFFQRPLRTPERGFCQFEKTERRAYKAYPISQKFRILQEVNALEVVNNGIIEVILTPEDRKKIIEILLKNTPPHIKKGMLSFAEMKKILNIKRVHFFNFEAENRKGFYADSTYAVFASPDCFGDRWEKLDDDLRENIVDLIIQNKEKEFKRIANEQFGFDDEKCEKILDTAMSLEDGTTSLSAKAMHKISKFLEDGELYHSACNMSGYDFNAGYEGKLYKELPYYGEILRTATIGGNTKFNPENKNEKEKYYGKITNPTVHVALNQLRKLVNKIFHVYGAPDKIVIETARDLPLGEKGLSEINKNNAKNKKDNERIAEELEKLNVANNAKNRMKYRLWEDLNPDPQKRCCPFCGKQIPPHKIFSPEFEIEHLLPFSITFDDSRGNKVLSCASCNRIFKGKHSPYEAFGNNPSYNWNEIVARVSEMSWARQWRFKPDALKIFEDQFGDFIARMLNDTRYMSKVAREYLTAVLPKEKIITVPGTITGKLRAHWGLNRILDTAAESDDESVKNRDDLRHHAVDAFVISSINRKLIALISRTARLAEEAGLENVLKALPSPFEKISYEQLKETIDNIKVSHKLDRGDVKAAIARGATVGKLHKDTAYGKIGKEEDGKLTLVKRVPLMNIEAKRDAIGQIANPQIRDALLEEFDKLAGLSESQIKNRWNEILMQFAEIKHVRRVRIHLKNRESHKLIKIADKSGNIYKYMDNDESYCIDIYKPSKSDKWSFEVINMYDAHKNEIPQWRKNDAHAKLVMRLYKRDTIAYEENGEYKIARVTGIATHGQISLLGLQISRVEGNPPKKMPNVLQKLNARKIYIDEIGRVYDPKKK